MKNFYYGDKENGGLAKNVTEAKLKRADFKTLEFPNFPGKVTLPDGRNVSYQIKVGPFGAYILTDIKNREGKDVIVNIPSRYCPGVVTESEFVSLLLSNQNIMGDDDPDKIVLKHGIHGDYWTWNGKIVYVPKGKKKAEDYTIEEIKFLFSLPIVLGPDKKGNDITLNYGMYGPYLNCDGKNYKFKGSIFDMNYEKALLIFDSIELEPYWDKPLEIRSGRYGYYLKWGEENIALPATYKKNPRSVTQEIAEKLCGKVDEPKTPSGALRDFGLFEGKALSILDGKYGPYVKWGDENITLSEQYRSNIDSITEDEIHKIARSHGAELSFGEVDGKPLGVFNGKYGYYLKWGKDNIKLPDNFKESYESLNKDEAIEIARSADIKPASKKRGRKK